MPRSTHWRMRLHFETLTSHDGTTCTIVWHKGGACPKRPPASMQIYNTAPSAADPAKGLELAHSLIKGGPMDGEQVHLESHYRERLDIYGLAMDASVSEDERIARCIAHQRHEIADREAKGRTDLHMMQWHWGLFDYRRFIVVIEKEIEDWKEGEMLFVFFDPLEKSDNYDDDYTPPAIKSKRVKGLEDLGWEIDHTRRYFVMQHAMDKGEFDDEYSKENLWFQEEE